VQIRHGSPGLALFLVAFHHGCHFDHLVVIDGVFVLKTAVIDDKMGTVDVYVVTGFSHGTKIGVRTCRTSEEAQAEKGGHGSIAKLGWTAITMTRWKFRKSPQSLEVPPEKKGTAPPYSQPRKSGAKSTPKSRITVKVYKRVNGELAGATGRRYETDSDYAAASAYYLKARAEADKVTWNAPVGPGRLASQ